MSYVDGVGTFTALPTGAANKIGSRVVFQPCVLYAQGSVRESFILILLVGSSTGCGLPSVTNDITSNQQFQVFYHFVFFFSIIRKEIRDHPLII